MVKFKKILIAVSIFISILSINCFNVPDDIILPEWDAGFNVPIMNKTFLMQDIVKKQAQITVDTTSEENIFLILSEEYYSNTGITKYVKINSASKSLNNPLPTSDTDSAIIYIDFPEDIKIDSAEFLEGAFTSIINNPSSIKATVTIRVPGITKPTGEQLEFKQIVSAFEVDSSEKNISGYKYRMPAYQSVSDRDKLMIIIKATSNQPTLVYLNLYNTDYYFDFLAGNIPSKSIGDQRKPFGFITNSIVNYDNSTVLKEASLNFYAYYKTQLSNPYTIELHNTNIIGKRNDGSEFLLKDESGGSEFDIFILNGSYYKLFTQDNSNVNDLISFLPDTIVVEAEYIINPYNEEGMVSYEDSIIFQTNFSTKSYVTLKKSSVEDTSSVELTENDRNSLQDGNSAALNIEIDNAIPLASWMKITLADENNNDLFTLINSITGKDSFYIEPAEVGLDGEVTASVHNSIQTILLDAEQIEMLSKSKYAIYSLSVQTKDAEKPDAPIVSVRPTDWMNVRIYGNLNFRVTP